MPYNVEQIYFVVSAYSGGTFASVETAKAEFREVAPDQTTRVIANCNIGC